MKQGVVVQFNDLRLVFAAINNARSFTGVAQAAARTRSLYASFKSYDFHDDSQIEVNFRSRPNRKAFNYSVNLVFLAYFGDKPTENAAFWLIPRTSTSPNRLW
jgi:hypothetical protein